VTVKHSVDVVVLLAQEQGVTIVNRRIAHIDAERRFSRATAQNKSNPQ
jgi:hypothetical protein